MHIRALLTPELTFCNLDGVSKKRVLETASDLLAGQIQSLAAEKIFSGLINRERLGSTGLGAGVAIPHCRLPGCTGIIGALFKLNDPVDFDSPDGEPVDLIFVLIVPEEAHEEHLQTLASIAETFSSPDYLSQLRRCNSSEQLYDSILKMAA